MSRTPKRGKSPGYEYWGKRPGSVYLSPGKDSKKIIHSIERAQSKKIAKKAKDEN